MKRLVLTIFFMFFALAASVHAADWLAWECGHIASVHTRCQALAPEVVEWLGFDEAAMEWAKAELKTQFQACTALLQISREG